MPLNGADQLGQRAANETAVRVSLRNGPGSRVENLGRGAGTTGQGDGWRPKELAHILGHGAALIRFGPKCDTSQLHDLTRRLFFRPAGLLGFPIFRGLGPASRDHFRRGRLKISKA